LGTGDTFLNAHPLLAFDSGLTVFSIGIFRYFHSAFLQGKSFFFTFLLFLGLFSSPVRMRVFFPLFFLRVMHDIPQSWKAAL